MHATCLKNIPEVKQKRAREKKRKLKQLKLQPKYYYINYNIV